MTLRPGFFQIARWRFKRQFIVSVLLVVAGHCFILQRALHGPTEYLTVRDDSISYLAMSDGDWDQAEAPFRYRVLVPALASILPFPSTDSLRLISYFGLFVSYFTILVICSKLGLGFFASVCGLFAVYSSAWHLYSYHNPFLTDSFGLMVLCLMIYALIGDSFRLFASASIAGILARETTVFLIPAWTFMNLRKGIILTFLALVILFFLRISMPAEVSSPASILTAFYSVGVQRLYSPLNFAKSIFLSLGFNCVFVLTGIWLVSDDKLRIILVAFLALFSGAFVSSLIATDIGRMFTFMMPVAVVACAQIFERLRKKGSILGMTTLVALWIAQAALSVPNALLGERFFLQYSQLCILLQVIGTLWGFWILYSLRLILITDLRKIDMISRLSRALGEIRARRTP